MTKMTNLGNCTDSPFGAFSGALGAQKSLWGPLPRKVVMTYGVVFEEPGFSLTTTLSNTGTGANLAKHGPARIYDKMMVF